MAPPPHVYLSRRLPQPALDLLGQHASVAVWPGELPPPRAVLHKEAAAADALLVLPGSQVDAALIAGAPRLRVVSSYGATCEGIDIAAATRRGIFITNTPDIATEATADFTVALMLAAGRRVVESEQYVKAGRWRAWGAEALLGRDLHGATLGIIGLGRVGQAVARRARGFGMRLTYSDPTRKIEAERELGAEHIPFEDLLAQSDILTLHCPLTDETYQLLDRDALERLKPEAILVNTAHGLLIDTRALVELLRRRPIIAALDVTDPEPLPPDHPLLALPNTLVTPHIASGSLRARERMALVAVEDLLAALRGERPRHLVNTELWPESAVSVGA